MKNDDSIEKIDNEINKLKNKRFVFEEENNELSEEAQEEIINKEKEEEVIEKAKELDEKVKENELEKTKELEEIKEETSNEEVTKELSNIEEDKTKEINIIEDFTKNIEKTNNNIDKVEQPKKEEKTKKNNKIVIIILSIIIAILAIVIVCIIVIPNLNKNENKVYEVEEEEYTSAQLKKILKNYGSAIENVIAINNSNESNTKITDFQTAAEKVAFPNTVKCKTSEVYEDGKIYLADCTIDGYTTKATYGEQQEKVEETAEVEAGSFNVYVKDKSATLDTPDNDKLNEYTVYKVTTGTTPTNITLMNKYDAKYVIYFDEQYNVHIKNFITNTEILSKVPHTSLIAIKTEDGFDTDYVIVNNNEIYSIYNINTETKTLNTDYASIYDIPSSYGITGPTEYIDVLEGNKIAVRTTSNKAGIINYKNGNIVINCTYDSLFKSGKYIWAYNVTYNGTESVYSNEAIFDYSGNRYLDNKYDKIYGIVNGKYILVKDSKEYKLVNIEGKEIYNYGSIKNIGSLNYFISYNDEPIFQFNKADKTNTSTENECIEVTYDSSKSKGSVKDYYCGGIAKPILYLYPTETTNVKVTFEHPEYLKTTYPKYKNGWEITAKTDGTLTDSNGRNYYALYWDEYQKHSVNFKTGFYVTKENAIRFLEEKLFEIGLTEREANEFIMYWLPKLEENKKSLVYFELTNERESYNKLNITPKPDSMLRLVIHIKKVNKKTSIKEEKLTTFQRSGFTAVEWGGVTY